MNRISHWEKAKYSCLEQHLLFLGSVVVATINFHPTFHFWPGGVCRLGEGKQPSSKNVWLVDCRLPVAYEGYESNWEYQPGSGEILHATKIDAMTDAERRLNDWLNTAKVNPPLWFNSAAEKQEWRCFHCGEVFTDTASAQLHFGRSEMREPICHVDQVKYREMEADLQRYRDEDTDLHREVHRAHNQGQEKASRAEEAGYAKGLGDYVKLEDAARLALHALKNLGIYGSDPSSIWLRHYPSATGDYVDLREFRSKAAPVVAALEAAGVKP